MLLGMQLQAQPFGAVIYVGDDSADLLLFDLTNPMYSKVEFYRGARMLGTVFPGAGGGGLITDYGLIKGTSYQYQTRAYRIGGGFEDGNLIDGYLIGGDLRGHLFRPDSIDITTDMVDSIFVHPGGHLHFTPRANVSWILGTAGTLSAIRILASSNPASTPHGQFSASGGQLYDVNIFCWGKFGPLKDFTFYGSDVFIYSNEESRFDNVTLKWVTDQGRNDYAYIRHYGNNIYATRCLLTDEGQMWGVKEADNMRIEKDASIVTSNIRNSVVDEGQITISPKDVPTTVRQNHIITGNVTISNQTVVEFNQFDDEATVNISPIAGGFDPADIKNVRINYNHFRRIGGRVGNISNFQADSIDGRLNYWGQCEGPTMGERATMGRVKLDPFLREPYPEASYWMELEPNKTRIIANEEDEITFTGRFYNVYTNADTAGVELAYLIIVRGDTLYQGVLTSGADGRFTFSFTMPRQYANVTGFSVFFTSTLQCIEKAYFMSIEAQSGPDLEVYSAEITQVLGPTQNIIANKPFAVKATILTTEPITTPFRVIVEVNGNVYEHFYILDRDNLGVQHEFENLRSEMTMQRIQPVIVVFLVNELGLDPGVAEISVTVDPPENGDFKGRIIESNEFNNTKVIYATVSESAFGNQGEQDLNVFVQAIDEYPPTGLPRLRGWADSAKVFMENTWPMKTGQVNMQTASNVADYSYINPDTLQQDTYQYYLTKAYKMMRLSNPAADRYVLAVKPDWFTYRLDRANFNHRASQTLSWSGTWDLMVASADHYKHVVHTLGHSFGLRRQDLDPADDTQREQYFDNFIGADVYRGIDFVGGRVMHANQQNKVSRSMRVKCFMGSSQTPSQSWEFVYWINDVEYDKLFAAYQQFTASKASLSKGVVPKAVFIEGTVDSLTRSFEFGPWLRLENATPSAMVDEIYATHIFKVLDAADQEIASYRYTPTFRALGLDEVDAASSPDPEMEIEHFGFVVPCPDEARRVIVEHNGNIVAERIITPNKPVVSIQFPTHGMDVKHEAFEARWSAYDPDGGTEFWYTVWFSTNSGSTWQILQFESQATRDSIFAIANTHGYKLRVVANDGVNHSDTVEVDFSVLTSTQDTPTPAAFELRQNYPNPFNPSTTLSFTLPTAAHATLIVYDALGRPVRTIVDGYRSSGTHSIGFNSDGLPSGHYIAVLRSGDQSANIRMTLAR